jgi:hypothetical protein
LGQKSRVSRFHPSTGGGNSNYVQADGDRFPDFAKRDLRASIEYINKHPELLKEQGSEEKFLRKAIQAFADNQPKLGEISVVKALLARECISPDNPSQWREWSNCFGSNDNFLQLLDYCQTKAGERREPF